MPVTTTSPASRVSNPVCAINAAETQPIDLDHDGMAGTADTNGELHSLFKFISGTDIASARSFFYYARSGGTDDTVRHGGALLEEKAELGVYRPLNRIINKFFVIAQYNLILSIFYGNLFYCSFTRALTFVKLSVNGD